MVVELEIYEPKTVEFDIDKMHQMVLDSCRKDFKDWDKLSNEGRIGYLIEDVYDNIDYYLEKQKIEAEFPESVLDYIVEKYKEYLSNPNVILC